MKSRQSRWCGDLQSLEDSVNKAFLQASCGLDGSCSSFQIKPHVLWKRFQVTFLSSHEGWTWNWNYVVLCQSHSASCVSFLILLELPSLYSSLQMIYWAGSLLSKKCYGRSQLDPTYLVMADYLSRSLYDHEHCLSNLGLEVLQTICP